MRFPDKTERAGLLEWKLIWRIRIIKIPAT